MSYHIESINVHVRELTPDRMSFQLGSKPVRRRPRGVLLVRMEVADDRGRRSWGVSGDRPSFGWLDKRPQYDPDQKLQRLFTLVGAARDIYLDSPKFDSPFAHWHECYQKVQKLGAETGHEPLTSSYASALFERAMIDAVCRLEKLSVFEALEGDRLGFDAGLVFEELKEIKFSEVMPPEPRVVFDIRHTVGLSDPLTAGDLTPETRINDGEPETLEEYVQRDGLRYFKVKIGGETEADLDRLGRIWDVVSQVSEPVVTFDANEAFEDLEEFEKFLDQFEERHLGMFQHTPFIEQPLTRGLSLDPATATAVRRIAERKTLIIDEADGELDSFKVAFDIGYDGTSHKNCKGFFKSLINYCFCRKWEEETGRAPFLTGEDLGNMPLVPLQQDYAALAVLNINHAERNGHHYGYGLSHLTAREKERTRQHHPDLYETRDDEMFLAIRNGQVRTGSLQRVGFGVSFEPEWEAHARMEDWEVQW